MRRSLLFLICFGSGILAYAQKPISIKIKDPVICYAGQEPHKHYIAPPKEYLDKINKPGARLNSATFEVTYIGFEGVPQAQQAFQRAVDIWASLLTSSVPIRIEARWRSLGTGVLGSANYTYAYANFKGAQKLDVFYPVAIAEKITGREMNEGQADIFANFSSTFTWHFNPDTPPAPGTYDLTTVVLHEIGHGLGFSGTTTVSGQTGSFGLPNLANVPIIYDVALEQGELNILETIGAPSEEFGDALTSRNLYFDMQNVRARVYAPQEFDPGSSISHVDEATYNNTASALMTPFVASEEQHMSPGISLDILKAIGWNTIRINHNPLPASEDLDGPYTVTAQIVADAGYDPSSVKLHYTTNGSTFTPVTMTSGPNNTFTGTIPGNGTNTYGYYISLSDNDGKEFVNPGKKVEPTEAQVQQYYTFDVVTEDVNDPVIIHTPEFFALDSETELEIRAIISDNIGSLTARLEYSINDIAQTDKILTLLEPQEDSIYSVTINIGSLQNGDFIKYRIVATDNSSNHNVSKSPETDFYRVNIIGLEPTQQTYINDFENSDRDGDFFGNGYIITKPSSFQNRAIHSEHPYTNGEGFPNNERELIYQLRVPIEVKATDATVKFDEIVLIEPGATGSVFGDDDFFDYVIVEGSLDGGITWEYLLDGYDASNQPVWLTRYNSQKDTDNNSTAVGDPALYRTRTINLLETFSPGDEVVIRFRTYIDQLSNAWGWSIDNLRIQYDETGPVILNDHYDYLVGEVMNLPIRTIVADESLVETLKFEIKLNGIFQELPVDIATSNETVDFTLTIENEDGSSFTPGDVIEYRIIATDGLGNSASFPSTGFIKVPVLAWGTPVIEYQNDFNTSSIDFVGNFFSREQPTGFVNGAIHSTHYYPNGSGLDKTSDFTYTLTKPIILSASNGRMQFNEIVIVEGHNADIQFGNPLFNDYVVVEGSKDGGETWKEFVPGYDAFGINNWTTAFNNKANGNSTMFRGRTIDMTASGDFETNDEVIIRFRLFSNETLNGWGWAIDDLFIQSTITGVETKLEETTAVYPNPSKGQFTVEAEGQSSLDFTIEVVNLQGQKLYEAHEQAVNGKIAHTISAQHFAAGMYLVKIKNGNNTVIRKVMRTN